MGICVRSVWLDFATQTEGSTETPESPLPGDRRLLHEAEQRAAEHTQRIAELSLYGHDTKRAKEFLGDFEQCIEGMRERLAEEEQMHSSGS